MFARQFGELDLVGLQIAIQSGHLFGQAHGLAVGNDGSEGFIALTPCCNGLELGRSQCLADVTPKS